MEIPSSMRHMASNRSLNGHTQINQGITASSRPSLNTSKENMTLTLLPSTLNNMLKTTTETGDLDLFFTRPRVPRSPAAPTRFYSPCKTGDVYHNEPPLWAQQHSRYLSTASGVDDRRCLPSYTRDATSEIVSMYETASQKASSLHRIEDRDARTFSMNQLFQSSNSLSNHRSFASLRSQTEFSLPQRPRSPFPYPTRLKRPGFRPSSPAFMDGGGIDYTRRVEIDRPPTSSTYNASSPSSLYASRRLPAPLSVRSDANRPNPYLLGPSPPRRPRLSQQVPTSDSLPDWKSRSSPGSLNASPGRNGCSLASMVNVYHSGPTPTRAPLSSPLYYDYTEDFEVERTPRESESVELLPPTLILIDKTIHEDNELGSEWSSLNPSPALTQGFESQVLAHVAIANGEGLSSDDGCQVKPDSSHSDQVVQGILSLYSTRYTSSDKGATQTSVSHDTLARQMEHHGVSNQVHRLVVGTNYSQATCLNEEKCESDLHHAAISMNDLDVGETKPDHGDILDLETTSNRSSAFSLYSHLPIFPKPPDRHVRISRDSATNARSQRGFIMRLDESQQADNDQELNLGAPERGTHFSSLDFRFNDLRAWSQKGASQANPVRSRLAGCKSTRPNYFFPVDNGSTDLAELILDAVDTSRTAREDLDQWPLDVPMKALPKVPDGKTLRAGRGPRNVLNKFRSDSDLQTSSGILKGIELPPLRAEPPIFRSEGANWRSRMKSVMHRPTRESMSLSDPPRLSPNILSPARSLNVKNSVPELMKALPPLPHPNNVLVRQTTDNDIGIHLWPLVSGLEKRGEPNSTDPATAIFAAPLADVDSGPMANSAQSTEPTWRPATPGEHSDNIESRPRPRPPPKFKLKFKSSGGRSSPSHRCSRPWNSEESYPWTGKQSLLLSSTLGKGNHADSHLGKLQSKPRTASISSLSTIKVNRHAKGRLSIRSIELRNPKDLFTTADRGLNDIFQEVSRHFHLARTSNTSIEQSHSEIEEPNNHAESHPLNPLDVRSFFSDNSFQVPDRNSLRKRISNLRSRKTLPYSSRIASWSHDDVSWTEQNAAGEARHLLGRRSRLNLNILRQGESKLNIPEVRLKLKSKVSRWLKSAKSAVAKVVHSRSNEV